MTPINFNPRALVMRDLEEQHDAIMEHMRAMTKINNKFVDELTELYRKNDRRTSKWSAYIVATSVVQSILTMFIIWTKTRC